MNKKGVEIGLNAVVIAAFALIVLVILIMIFKMQVGRTSQKYIEISDSSSAQASGKVPCGILFDPEHKCSKDDISDSAYRWHSLGQGPDSGCSQGYTCYERGGLRNEGND